MTSTTRDTVPEKLREAIAKEEPPSIGKEPYVKDDKFNTNYLTEWQNKGSFMAFMEPGRKGVGVAMLIGAESGNIITYAMSNKTERFVDFNLETLNKKVKTGWPTAATLRSKSNFLKATKLKKQDVPVFFPLAASKVEVILHNEEVTPQKLMNEKDMKENTKFWLKFAAGCSSDKKSSILAINLPTCTTILSTTLYKQINYAWEGDNVMDAITSALPTGLAPPTPEEAAAAATANTPKSILRPTSPKTTNTDTNNPEEEEITTTTTTTEVKGCNAGFAKGTKPPSNKENNKTNTAAGNVIVPFQTNGQPNNSHGNQWGNQPSNQFQQGWGNQYSNQNYNPFSNGFQPMGGNMFQQPQMFNNLFKSTYGQWNYNNNIGAMNNQQIMKMQGKENQVVKPSPSYSEHKEEYVALLMENLKGGKETDPRKAASLTALGNIFSAKSTTTTMNSNKEAWYQSNKPAIKAWSGFNPNILTMNGGLFEVICSSAHKNTKK